MTNKQKKYQSVILYSVLILYIVICLAILIFKYVSPLDLLSSNRSWHRSANIEFFATIKSYLNLYSYGVKNIALQNIVGNVVLFIPMGIYFQLFKKYKNPIISIVNVFFVSVIVEISQYLFAVGATDVDDILLNTLGGIIGVMCYQILKFIVKDDDKVRKFVTIASALVGIPLFFIIMLLAINN